MKSIIYYSWMKFLIKYRSTTLGPAWLLVGPGLFILFLGTLFSQINRLDTTVFIPHLAIGLIVWTLINGFVSGSTTIFRRSRAQILQSGTRLFDLVVTDVTFTVLQFLHQIILVAFVMLFYQRGIGLYAFVSLIGVALLILNGFLLGIVFGIIGARYRDLAEVMHAVMRIAFLATPVIWMPGEPGRGSLMNIFLNYNPFYHFLELIRAPLLDQPIAPLSWAVVLVITLLGIWFAKVFYLRFHKQVPLWV